MNEVPVIACLFKWNEKKAKWQHTRTVIGNEDGHWREGDDPYLWCHKRDSDDDDWEAIPGRLATLWMVVNGLRLQWFSAPSRCEWIESDVVSLPEGTNPRLAFRAISGGVEVYGKSRDEVCRVLLEMM
jgi:hypothetical protein